MSKRVTIDPITRLEGHGKIEIFLDDNGDVANAYFQVPELRGFEKFSEGRMCEEMPRITPKICGVCPTAHHMAATKALDDLYKVTPPVTAVLIRRLIYNAFMFPTSSSGRTRRPRSATCSESSPRSGSRSAAGSST